MQKPIDYLKSERQWPRHLRIRKARMALAWAETAEQKAFWHQVLDRLNVMVSGRVLASTSEMLERSLENDNANT